MLLKQLKARKNCLWREWSKFLKKISDRDKNPKMKGKKNGMVSFWVSKIFSFSSPRGKILLGGGSPPLGKGFWALLSYQRVFPLNFNKRGLFLGGDFISQITLENKKLTLFFLFWMIWNGQIDPPKTFHQRWIFYTCKKTFFWFLLNSSESGKKKTEFLQLKGELDDLSLASQHGDNWSFIWHFYTSKTPKLKFSSINPKAVDGFKTNSMKIKKFFIFGGSSLIGPKRGHVG